MNESMSPASKESHTPVAEGETGLLDWLIVLAKRKKLVLGLPALFAIFAIAITLVMPNIYKATAKILPPQQSQSSAAAILSQLGGLAGAAGGAIGIKNTNDMYVGMLRSRTIGDNLIQRFDLKKVYDVDLLEKARKELAINTHIATGKDGLIAIEVEDIDPKRAAQIANAYIEELLKLTNTLAVTEASQRRLFFERQLQATKDKLAELEIGLKGALDTTGVVSVDSQSRAMLETIARLRAHISAKEIELGAMQAFVTIHNQEYKRSQQELSSMRAELAKLENGTPVAQKQGEQAEKQVGLDNIKLLRDVKYYQMLYELLSKQYEIARLDEAKDSSIIQVLDKALEPERKFKPKRAVIVEMSALLGFFLAIIWAFVSEALEKARHRSEQKKQLMALKAYLRFR
jgi:tyrosine-protein kinase Etk/Wzc